MTNQKYINHSFIKVGKKVFATSENSNFGNIIGGKIVAGEEITANRTGNSFNTLTELETGINPFVKKEIETLYKEIGQLQEQYASLKKQGLFVYNLLKKPINLEAVKTTTEIQALLNEAGQLYAKHQYSQALTLYQEAAAQPNGQVLRTYAGLYITYLQLDQTNAASQAFNKLLELNFKQSPVLTLKILFKVGSEEFYGDHLVQNQYKLWIKNIGQYLQASNRCLIVAGHSSRSGSASFNEGLSLKRATTVQNLMQEETPAVVGKIRAEGKGFSENIIGSGTDNEQDKLDRRTEFKLSDCSI